MVFSKIIFFWPVHLPTDCESTKQLQENSITATLLIGLLRRFVGSPFVLVFKRKINGFSAIRSRNRCYFETASN